MLARTSTAVSACKNGLGWKDLGESAAYEGFGMLAMSGTCWVPVFPLNWSIGENGTPGTAGIATKAFLQVGFRFMHALGRMS